LPDQFQYSQFQQTIKNHTMVHEKLKTFIAGFKDNAHPMAIMVPALPCLADTTPRETEKMGTTR